MLAPRTSFFHARIALLPAVLSMALLGALASGCGETTTSGGGGGEGGAGGSTSSNAGGGGSGGAAACDSTLGTLEGTAYLYAPAGQPNSTPAANATIVLLTAPEATPLYGEADEAGHFSIPLEAGQWLVGGEHQSNCQTTEPITIQLDPCETEQLDLLLDACFDG